MRAEVGLLTRNILIRGVMERSCNPDTNENCGEFSHDTYGGHIKVFRDNAFSMIRRRFSGIYFKGTPLIRYCIIDFKVHNY